MNSSAGQAWPLSCRTKPQMRRLMLWAALLALVPLSAATATPATGTYDIPVWFNWNKTVLDVVIVPPNHGQIYNEDGVFGGGSANELTTDNSYMKAIKASIADWDRAINEFGSPALSSKLVINVHTFGQGDAPLFGDILIVTDETKALVLGVAVSLRPCIVNNSKMYIKSFTYADMFNVNGQEFGHCLGLDHVVDEEPSLDVMNGLYPHYLGSSGNPLHCTSNLDVAGLEKVFFGGGDTASMPMQDYRTTDCE